MLNIGGHIMDFNEKLREYRKQSGLSQGKLAETLNVSRQAITKWESGNGMPDISNLKALSAVFNISVDELLSEEAVKLRYPYESIVEYDIDEIKHFDIKLGSVNHVKMRAGEGEKIKVQLVSDTIENLTELVKVKIDDIKRRIDVDVNRSKSLSEEIAKEHLSIFINLPEKYMGDTELAIHCEKLELFDIISEKFELDGEAKEIYIAGGNSHIELDNNSLMEIYVADYTGRIDVNQISAKSRLHVPHEYAFKAVKKGIRTKLLFEDRGHLVDDFSVSESENQIEINGINSELTIVKLSE
ncbi:helix-turn-helix transcriptional regulator [Veillonella parvula]|nr:helix-turn-helix transcriptional regulator [Veillonella parvula]MDU1044800.1 helix-turn-helix transcriptional regulator [Veillonella parvula]MDU5708938.1 helix-turn-helix transcriptional regulator [Veillonella sp.]